MSSPISLEQTTVPTQATALKEQMLSAVLAGALGLLIIYAAGFAEASPLHNAAHDGRHSASFPCH